MSVYVLIDFTDISYLILDTYQPEQELESVADKKYFEILVILVVFRSISDIKNVLFICNRLYRTTSPEPGIIDYQFIIILKK